MYFRTFVTLSGLYCCEYLRQCLRLKANGVIAAYNTRATIGSRVCGSAHRKPAGQLIHYQPSYPYTGTCTTLIRSGDRTITCNHKFFITYAPLNTSRNDHIPKGFQINSFIHLPVSHPQPLYVPRINFRLFFNLFYQKRLNLECDEVNNSC